MPNSNKEKQPFLLLELLENFSKKELKGLQYFVACRYFNTDKYVVKLLETIVNEVIGKKVMSATVVQKRMYIKVFGKPASEELLKKEKDTFNAKMNALTRLAERFLMAESLEEKEAYKSDLLLEKLLQKKQYQLFDRHINKVQKRVEGIKKDTLYQEHQLHINRHRLNYINARSMLRKTDNLYEINQRLDLRYLLDKLDVYLSAHSVQKYIKGRSYDFLHSKEIDCLIDKPEYTEQPIVKVYMAAIQLTIDRSYENYGNLFALLTKFEQDIPQELCKDSYFSLLNFWTHQVKTGDTDSYQQQFDLYSILDEKNLLIKGGMPIQKFKNIITAACHIHNYEWAEQAVERYIPYVEQKNRNNVKHFSLGAIAFYKRDYDSSKIHFSEIDKSISPIYDLNHKIIVAKREYEIGDDYDFTLTTMESTEKHIYASRMKGEEKAPYIRFIRMLINLFNIKHSIGKKSLESVKKELQATQHISDKKWLEEKIHELEINPPTPS